MRIAYFTHYFPPAGFAASVNTYEIVRRLAMRGHKVLVFAQPTFRKGVVQPMTQYREGLPQNLEIHQSLSTPLPLSVMVPHILNITKSMKYDFDLVITQFHAFHLASFPGYVIKILEKKPWVVKVQDLMLDPSLPASLFEKMFISLYYHRAFLGFLGKKADKILVLTGRLKRLLEGLSFDSKRLTIMRHGVDTRLFSPSDSESKSELVKEILYIGSMRAQYGLDSLVKAFGLLRSTESLKLILIGQGPDRNRLMELAKNLRLEKNVEFHNYVPHDALPKVIQKAYVTVGPLRPSLANYYTIPTKALEYFACGKPMVSTEVCEDVLVDGYTGLLLETSTPEDIAEKLSSLIEDEKLTASIGRNARRLVMEKFDWEKIIDNLETELQGVVHECQ